MADLQNKHSSSSNDSLKLHSLPSKLNNTKVVNFSLYPLFNNVTSSCYYIGVHMGSNVLCGVSYLFLNWLCNPKTGQNNNNKKKTSVGYNKCIALLFQKTFRFRVCSHLAGSVQLKWIWLLCRYRSRYLQCTCVPKRFLADAIIEACLLSSPWQQLCVFVQV